MRALIIFLFFTSLSMAEVPNIKHTYSAYNLTKPYGVNILHEIPYRPYSTSESSSDEEIKKFKSRVLKYSRRYVLEMEKRIPKYLIRKPRGWTDFAEIKDENGKFHFITNIYFNNFDPVRRFTFMMELPNSIPKPKRKDHHYSGMCFSNARIIFLKPNFSESTFFHELGHCHLGYSHKADSRVAYSGKSRYLMNWKFDHKYYGMKAKEVFDQFFKIQDHHSLISKKGHEEHAQMEKFIEEYSSKLEKNKKQKTERLVNNTHKLINNK